MTTAAVWGLCLLVGAVAWVLTGVMRQYALNQQLMDVPGCRSSHSVPTPRGGGVAIVIATVGAFLLPVVTGGVPLLPVGVVGAALLVAAIGFVDDHRSLPAGLRLAAHIAAAVMAVVSLGGTPTLVVWGTVIDPGLVGHALATVFIVWLLNLTNFMDGIDGIVGVQVAAVCVVGGLLYGLTAVNVPDAGVWVAPFVLAAATTGFLVWNWPPARIFMGDVGSGYIGFLFGVFALRAGTVTPELLWAWIVLLGVFVVDATVTLLIRLGNRERVFDAHRSHAYQHLAITWKSHRRVTGLVLIINMVWLAPIAGLVAVGAVDGLLGVGIAYAPLIVGVVRLGAGVHVSQSPVLGS